MNKNIIIQSIIVIIILLILGIFYSKYFSKDKTEQFKKKKQTIENVEINKKSSDLSNIIKNIEYIAEDNSGNKYLIEADSGEINRKNADIILMKNVKAKMTSNKYDVVYIYADTAVYNVKDYNTNFSKNIVVDYLEHKIKCEKLELSFQDHKISLYKDINYTNLDTNFLADAMEIDLMKKSSRIYMNNKDEKIKIIFNK